MVQGTETIPSPGFDVPVVDTTGASDCFVGGFLAATLRGFSLLDAARFANAVGALSVQHLGGTTGLLGWDEPVEWAGKQTTRVPNSRLSTI